MSDEQAPPEPAVEITNEVVAGPRKFSAVSAKKTGMIKTVYVQMDGGLAQKIIALREKINETKRSDKKSNLPDQVPVLTRELEELLEHAKESEEPFTFRSIGRPKYEKLLFECRPTQAQKKEGFQYNPDKFCPALVAATCVDPIITDEEATALFDDPDWNNAELMKLFLAANEVNTELPDIPLSNSAIGQILDIVSKLTTASDTESPTADS